MEGFSLTFFLFFSAGQQNREISLIHTKWDFHILSPSSAFLAANPSHFDHTIYQKLSIWECGREDWDEWAYILQKRTYWLRWADLTNFFETPLKTF